MKILFAIPKSKSLFGDESNIPENTEGTGGHPHLGIAYLTSFLKQKGVEVKIYDDTIDNNINKVKQIIDLFAPDLIGITAFSYSYIYVTDLIEKIKNITKTKIVIGGPHVSATKEEILKNTRADFAIKGEGENTLYDLLLKYNDSKEDLSSIDGLLWRNDDKIIENNDRPFITDLDSLPYPDFEAFRLDKYNYTSQNKLPIISSRGCPYSCTFCSVKLSMGRGFRARSPEKFVEELQYWYKKGWTRYEINDDCYSTDINRVIEISDLIVKNNLKIHYEIYNGIRVDRVNPIVLKKLKESGCTLLSYGVESGSEKILKNIRKNITLEQVRKAVDWANDAKIPNSVNFIIGHKGETLETAKASIKFASSLPTNFVNFYNLVPYPGTEAFDWAKEHGKFLVPLDTYLQHISYRDNLPIFETSEFSLKERKKVISEGFKLYEKKILEFRLGKRLGYIAYLFMRIKPLAKFGVNFALNNKVGNKVYIWISKGSR